MNQNNKRDKAAETYFNQYRDPMKSAETLVGVTQVDEHFKAGWDLRDVDFKVLEFATEQFLLAYLAEDPKVGFYGFQLTALLGKLKNERRGDK